MVVKVTVDISDALADLRRIGKGLNNLTPLVRELGLYMERETKQNITKGTTFDGQPFAPLAQSTLRRKRSGRILQETGTMVNSISSKARGNRAVVGPDGVKYAVYHQFGTSKMPARPFVGVAARHEPGLKKITDRYIQDLIS